MRKILPGMAMVFALLMILIVPLPAAAERDVALFLNSRAMPALIERLAPETVYVYHLTGDGEDSQSMFYRRVTERAEKRLPRGLVRRFGAGAQASF